MSQGTAERYMAVAGRLGDKICTVQNLSPATLYRLSARSTPAALRTDIIHRLEIGEQLSETEVQRQIAEAGALQPISAEPVEQETPFRPSAHRTDDVLGSIKQEWSKLTTSQQQEFLGWARLCLEHKTAEQPQPHSPQEAHDDVAVPTQTPVQCKIRRGCRYSGCRERARCLHDQSATELARLGNSAS